MEYGGISTTAIMNARGRRHCTEIPYAREIADIIDREGIKDSLSGLYPILKPIVKAFPNAFAEAAIGEGRYLTVNKTIEQFREESGEFSTLEIAVGLSPRSLNLAEKGMLYMETDQEKMIRLKERIIKEIREGEEGFQKHLFFNLDALTPSDWEKAGRRYRDLGEGKPLLVIVEGLMRYLNRDEQLSLGNNINYLLRKYSPYGAWITADLDIKPERELNWVLKLLTKRIKGETKKEFNYFKDEEEIEEFIRKTGFTGKKVFDESIVEEMTCIRKMNFDIDLVKEVIKIYPAYLMRLLK